MPHDETDIYEFGDFRVDPAQRLLFRNGTVAPVPPKAFDILLILIRNGGRTVDKQELMRAVWSDTFVEEANLAQNISLLRKALGETAEDRRFIQTIPRRGYRFLPAVLIKTESAVGEPQRIEQVHPPVVLPEQVAVRKVLLAAAVILLLIAGLLISRPSVGDRADAGYEQITNFADSVVAPALSPDGRMVAFLRSDNWFLSSDQIYLKWLPDGDPVQLTHDTRLKFAPVFSPDSSQLAYSISDPLRSTWETMAISVLGGEPHVMLPNSAGLTWLNSKQLLFSEIKTGLHMTITTAAPNRVGSRDVYVPQHERAMAHFSHASPDRKWVLVVEMDHTAAWLPCRLVPFDGSSPGRTAGPPGSCTSAAWSPDGNWMYFGVRLAGNHHLWRQRFPGGEPEQITFGPTEEEGIAIAPNGQSLITSIGMHQSAIWLHDSVGERALSSEGLASEPMFSSDGKSVYYLVRRESPASPNELYVAGLEGGGIEPLVRGFSIDRYDVSRNGNEILFATTGREGTSQLWLSPADRRAPPRRVASSGEDDPFFGPAGELLFRAPENGANYLFRMNRDGTGRQKAAVYPISTIFGVSPDRKWVAALAPVREQEAGADVIAIPTMGGPPQRICSGFCAPRWAPNGRFLYVITQPDRGSKHANLVALPIPSGKSLPDLPPSGITSKEQAVSLAARPAVRIEGGRSERGHTDVAPGMSPSVFAYVKKSVHRNLFRVPLQNR